MPRENIPKSSSHRVPLPHHHLHVHYNLLRLFGSTHFASVPPRMAQFDIGVALRQPRLGRGGLHWHIPLRILMFLPYSHALLRSWLCLHRTIRIGTRYTGGIYRVLLRMPVGSGGVFCEESVLDAAARGTIFGQVSDREGGGSFF